MLKTFLALLSLLVAIPAFAATAEVGPEVTITATKDAGNAIITWSGPIQVGTVEHYIGHGRRGGYVHGIVVSGNKAVLGNVAQNGGRLQLRLSSGEYLHLECGGNGQTVMPTLVGLAVDCTCVKRDGASGGTCFKSIPEGQPIPAGAHREGALVVQ